MRHRTALTLALAATLPLALIAAAHAAGPAGRIAVTDLKPLLARAAAEGSARGVLTGPGAQAIARRFQTDAPSEVDVRRLQRLPEPGCGRLEVTTRQQAVAQDGQPRREQELVYQISFCDDGRFPEDR